MKRTITLALLLILPLCGWAAKETKDVDLKSNNPAIEARLHVLAKELRCLVCQNQTLADSEAELAIDLRNEIRALLEKGLTDEQVVDYLVQRYGDFVRFRPPVNEMTFLLWFGPLLLVVLGSGLLIFYLKRLPSRANNAPLSDAEHKRLDKLLSEAKED
ncbi:MAG TPA: cytochrome c-type biogenesis protein [Gammaproteobacteria bacterium]|nr:cytochrome c-type biogenesis protein [Gammaproteobacteria bacterium]